MAGSALTATAALPCTIDPPTASGERSRADPRMAYSDGPKGLCRTQWACATREAWASCLLAGQRSMAWHLRACSNRRSQRHRPLPTLASAQKLNERLPKLPAGGLSPHVCRTHVGLRKQSLDGAEDGGGSLLVAQVLQHQGARPNLANGVGDALAGDVRSAAMHRLEHRRKLTLGIDIGAGRDGDGAGGGRTQVRKDVAEQVGTDDHVEPGWVAHQMRRQNVDVELAGLDLRVLFGDGGKSLIPKGHRDRDAVRLGGRGHLLAPALHGKIESVAHDPIATLAREDRHLGRLLELGALEAAPTDGRIFALVVLAHDQIVDVARLAVGERGLQTMEEAHGSQIDVLLEAAADGNEQAPQRYMVRDARPAHGAEVDGVVLGDLFKTVGRHHGTGLGKPLAGPVVAVPGVVDPEPRSHRLEHAHALRHHLVADPVTWDHGDPELVG